MNIWLNLGLLFFNSTTLIIYFNHRSLYSSTMYYAKGDDVKFVGTDERVYKNMS